MDEAAITVNESKTLGRSYICITPINIYKFVNKSINGEEYTGFLLEVNEFFLKFICNNQIEVVIIEDNCLMYMSKIVEKQLEN